MALSANASKFFLYENTVQNPEWHVRYPSQFHRRLVGKSPLKFREDFCGSGKISCEWVKVSKRHYATGIDANAMVLRYANDTNKEVLSEHQQARLAFWQKDVAHVSREKFDIIGAYNFSIFEFHERKNLLRYFKSVFKSLANPGTFFCDVAGGSGFLRTRQRIQNLEILGIGKVQQVWEQMDYDPISATNKYAIHFMLPNGSCFNKAFKYHWRIWQIKEVREILKEAGFKKSVVIWERDTDDRYGSGQSYLAEKAENAYSWVAYVVGIK